MFFVFFLLFSPALCDIETSVCNHLLWRKVQADCWVDYHGPRQSVINVSLHAAATETKQYNVRRSTVLQCLMSDKHK